MATRRVTDGGRVIVHVGADLKRRLRKAAQASRLSMGAYVRLLLLERFPDRVPPSAAGGGEA